MAFRARKHFGTFEKRVTEHLQPKTLVNIVNNKTPAGVDAGCVEL